MSADFSEPKHIACFLPTLFGGGAERVGINLAAGFARRGHSVDLVLGSEEGAYAGLIPREIRVVELGSPRVSRLVLRLASYLRREKPHALIAHMSHANLAAILAEAIARSGVRMIVVEHFVMDISKSSFRRDRLILPLARRLYKRADAVVAVSRDAGESLRQRLRLPSGAVRIIYNPVVDETLVGKAAAELRHPWFGADSPPVFLAVGRLTPQKDFATLLAAFAALRRSRPARLIILGDGECRRRLEELAADLDIAADLQMPGFVENPFPYMRKAAGLVLSSRWEALPTVLIEAMACGCPVAATDCPFGPREILDDGRYGPLAPAGDPQALAEAMVRVLDEPMDGALLIQRSQDFSVDRSVDAYLELLSERRSGDS